MMVVRGCRWLFFFFFSEKKSAKLKGCIMIESYQCLDCFLFECCESIKKTPTNSWHLNCWKPTSLKWLDCFGKASKTARTAFDLQSDEGYVSKGQLLWMLADSGMPVNKAGWRWPLRCFVKKSGGGAFASQMARIHLHLFVSVVVLLEHPIGKSLNFLSLRKY